MNSKVIEIGEKRLTRMPPEELSLQLMRLPARKRLEVILSREDSEAVVSALPEQDFYLSLKDIGSEDAVSLLSLASVTQLNYLFDLEWWQKDQILPARAVEWLDRLARSSESKLIKWLYDADFELLLSLFKKWLHVEFLAEDSDLNEMRDQLPKNTLDDQYFWETIYPQYEDFLRQLLSLIFEISYGFYKELMNHIIWATDTESEEAAYQFHKVRLEEHAIPDFYDAVAIYQSMETDEISYIKNIRVAADSISPPFFALAVVPDGDLLGRVLREIRAPYVISSVQLELAAIANKVVVADQLPSDNPENLRLAIHKTAAYVNLGLQLLGGESPQRAQACLSEVYLEHLFRVGQTKVKKLKDRMHRLYQKGWISRWPEKLHCLEPNWMEPIESLMRRTPRMLRYSDSTRSPQEDFFRTIADLQRANHLLDVVESLGAVLNSLAPKVEYLQWVLWQDGQVRDLADVTIANMLWTAAASFQSDGIWEVEPVALSRWNEVFSLLNADTLEQTVLSWIDASISDPVSIDHITSYLSPIFASYREEMAPFNASNPPDPGMIRCFLIKA